MSSKDSDVSRCAFTSSDGRQCRMLRAYADVQFCPHHRRKLRNFRDSDRLVDDLFAPISRGFITAASLSQSMARLFAAVAAGRIGPKSAVAVTHVADTLLKSIAVSGGEFSTAFNGSQWKRVVRASIGNLSEFSRPAPLPSPDEPSGLSKSVRRSSKRQARTREDSEHDTSAEGSAALPRQL